MPHLVFIEGYKGAEKGEEMAFLYLTLEFLFVIRLTDAAPEMAILEIAQKMKRLVTHSGNYNRYVMHWPNQINDVNVLIKTSPHTLLHIMVFL